MISNSRPKHTCIDSTHTIQGYGVFWKAQCQTASVLQIWEGQTWWLDESERWEVAEYEGEGRTFKYAYMRHGVILSTTPSNAWGMNYYISENIVCTS